MENITSFPDLGAKLTQRVIGSAIEVHKNLGPGLLESVYESCLSRELEIAGIHFERQKHLPVHYKNTVIEQGFRMDLIVEDELVVEIKAADRLQPVHEAQLMTYLKLSGYKLGLLINFNEKLLKSGIRRLAMSSI